jgi:hypothetical protein
MAYTTNAPSSSRKPGSGSTISSPMKDTLKSGDASTKRDKPAKK